MSKIYKLKVNKIPLSDDIIYKKPNFPPYPNLHLDLLENKQKLKKHPPKPIFVYNEPSSRDSKKESFKSSSNSDNSSSSDDDNDKEKYVEKDDDEYTLEELERAYNADEGEIFHDNDNDREKDEKRPTDKDKNKDAKRDTENYEKDESSTAEYKKDDFKQMEDEEEDAEATERKEKSDLLFKFMVLRKKYPNVEIPEFSEHSELGNMKRIYEQILRRVHLDSSVEDYRSYLLAGMMMTEFVSTNWMGIDLSGFTNQQRGVINKYDRLLIELGEKNYSSVASRLPVEIRLIGFILFNAGLFFVQKMMFGGGNMSMLSSFFGSDTSQNKQYTPPPPKRGNKMNGPTISPTEIEELHKRQSSDSESENEDKKKR